VSPSPGELVTANVRLERPLGEGGMGSVWRARHLGLDVEVAVKFMAPDIVGSAEMRERFAREARSAARIDSPHVVRMFDHGVTPAGVPYIVMELCHGESLRDRLTRLGALELRAAERAVSGLCLALAAAHDLGIVHRDIKPENVFLHGEQATVKVLDFGIAKAPVAAKAAALTAADQVMGTPAYMSLEQLFSPASVSPAFDLWAAAAVAYEAITGARPFPGETLNALIVLMHDGRFVRPTSLGLAASFDAFFERAFHRDAAQRFASARELSDAFARAIDAAPGRPPMAASAFESAPTFAGVAPTLPQTPVVAAPRRSRAGLWAALAGVLVVVGAVVAWVALRREPEPVSDDDAPRRSGKTRAPAPTPADLAGCVGTWAELHPLEATIYTVNLRAERDLEASMTSRYRVESSGVEDGKLRFGYFDSANGYRQTFVCPCTLEVTMACNATHTTGPRKQSIHRVRFRERSDFVGAWRGGEPPATYSVYVAGDAVHVSSQGGAVGAELSDGVLSWPGAGKHVTRCIVAEKGRTLRCVAGDNIARERPVDLGFQQGW
jgi:hypothetical protein